MTDARSPLLTGTLDLLILKTLSVGVLHGYGIAQQIHRLSREALNVEEGSLYPALQRMEAKGWVSSDWKQTPTGRRARYYRLTAAGKKPCLVTTAIAREMAAFLWAIGQQVAPRLAG